jgi:phage-related protein
MPELADWSMVFFVDEGGGEPVQEFLAGLDRRTQARFDWAIEQLLLRNTRAGEPLVRHLEGKIWELRRESDTNSYRLLYAFLPGRRILFLHGFQKKTQKTSRREIEIARTRLASFLRREGGNHRQ